MTSHVNRRIFLRGLGGACVAAPFLSSVAERSVKAAAMKRAKRLIVMYTDYGCVTNRFLPTKSHGALTAADLEPTALKHLAPYVDKLLLPRGIRAMNEWTGNLSRGQGNDMHTQMAASFFTCQPVTPNSDDPFSFDGIWIPMPVGPSVDHVMAQQLSSNGLPLFLRVGNVTESQQTAISFSASEKRYPSVSLSQAFAALTGLMQPGAPVSPDTYQAMRGKSIIDLVRGDLNTLERADMSRSDRNKLDAWKQLLDETGRGVTQASCSEEGATVLGVTKANLSAVSSATSLNPGTDQLTAPITASMDVADLHANFAVLAALCDLNPIVFLRYPSNFVFKGLGINMDSHNLSHRLDNAGLTGPCVPGALDMLRKIDDYYARKFAHLVGLLNSINDGEGKLLDQSVAIWFQGQSDGIAHNLNNLPIVQAGSGGGYFKTGWAVNVENGAADLTPGNSEAFCADGTAAGMVTYTNDPITGTNPALANAPINKYFCNLMNALGVKAGADGFALKDGTAEVTRFGMYDKTEDFIHGGTNPPTIHDPGEFTALKA